MGTHTNTQSEIKKTKYMKNFTLLKKLEALVLPCFSQDRISNREMTIGQKTKHCQRLIGCVVLFLTLGVIGNANAQIKGGAQNLTFSQGREAVENSYDLERLLFGIQPTFYVNTEGMWQISHEVPVVVECDANAIASLYMENEAFKNIKVIHINIDNSGYPELDVMSLQRFDNLEYININFRYSACGDKSQACLLPLVQSMVKPGAKSIKVLYQLVIFE